MQHDHVLETLNFDLLTPPPGSTAKIFAICYHVAACLILLQHDHILNDFADMHFTLFTCAECAPSF